MKSITLRYCLALLIIPLAPILSAQVLLSDAPDSEPSAHALHYVLNHPNENFVIQTDRDLYFSGTELWFSVWSLDDQTLSPFSYSGIVYVELMDKNGKSVEQQILKLDNYRAHGRITLPDRIESGVYYLRVYSNLQRNYGEHLFGIKIIEVVNPTKPPVLTVMEDGRNPIISLFPEGQRLLHGITNKLVVKAIYPNGCYAGLTNGFLIRQPADTIAELEFIIPGMGYCSFYTDTSYSYYLDLPGMGKIPLEIQEKGLTVHIQEGESQLRLKLLGKDATVMENSTLVGKIRGEVFFERALEQGLEEVNFPYSSLPAGLLEFAILNSDYEEYCQRLYYHDKSTNPPSYDLLFNKLTFVKGESITMEVLLPDDKVFELISLVVRKDLFVINPQNQEFRFYVDLHPFLNDWDEIAQLTPAIPRDSLAEFLDNYLITKKSKRFKWQDIFQAKQKKLDFTPEVDVKRVTGYGFNPVNNARIRNDNLALYFVGREATLLSSRTDQEGRFSFEYPAYKTGMSEIEVLPFRHNDKMEVSLDWPFHESFHKYKLDFFHFDSSRFEDFDRAYLQALLEKMYNSKEMTSTDNKNRVIAFYGEPDSRTFLKDYISMSNMEEAFKEIVPGEKLKISEDEVSLQIYHRDKYASLGDHPLLLFNGAPVLNAKELLGIPVSGVDFVDMVRQHYIIHNQLYDGIINVVSRDLNLQLKIPQNSYKTSTDLFPQESRFNLDRERPESRIPDLNPTLYWNPDLTIDGNSRHIKFNAGDNSGRYQVRLRGIDSSGESLEIIRYINVE